jgi:23S rRNA (adenine2503-C2)-methyltransferase
MKLRLLEMTHAELAAAFGTHFGKGPYLAGALYREFYKQLNPQAWQASAIQASPGLPDRLRQSMAYAPGEIVDEVHCEGVVKFVTELHDGQRIESVVLPMVSHDTVCVSSQAGCRMGCRFCETARLGLVRHLTTEEIVGQVYQARKRFGPRIRNVVFMGMGEPFDNFDAVIQAVRVLSDQRGLDIAQRYITLSTAGRIDGIEKMAALGMPHLKLAVSLNAPDDALRSLLMPINQAAPLDRLQKALAAYPLKKGAAVMIAYVLIPGVNDSPECARALSHWLAPLQAKVNLIPFNPGTAASYRPPTDAELERFRQWLIGMHVNVQKRASLGRDLMAACGQLGRATTGRQAS